MQCFSFLYLFVISSWNMPSGNWLKDAAAMAAELPSKYILPEYRNSPLRAQSSVRGFIVQFLCLKVEISYYFVGNMTFNTRPLGNENLMLFAKRHFYMG